MRRTAPLQVLDEYAKKLTKKQASMLYENKLNKKYSKKIYESYEKNLFSVYVDSYCIANKGLYAEEIIDEVNVTADFPESLSIVNNEEGVMFTTPYELTFNSLISILRDFGITSDEISISEKSESYID